MLRRGREEVKESWSAYRAKRPVLAFALSWKSGPFRAALGVGYGRGLYPPVVAFGCSAGESVHRG